MKFVEVLKECEGASGAGTKKIIQGALAKLDADGRKLMRYALDPYRVYGVRKFDRPLTYAETDPTDISFLYSLLDALANRELTGNAARDAVTQFLGDFTKETAEYIERIIDKDPKGGFSAETFNKVWPSDPIPTWEQQLADKCEDAEDFDRYVTFPCQADVKYDGNRMFAFVKEGQPVVYRARGGKLADHLEGQFDEELQVIRAKYGQDFVLDGEIMASSFTETMNAKGSKNTEARKNLIYRAFFIMPITDWIAQKTEITNGKARELLTELLRNCKRIVITVGRMVSDYQDMTAYCNEVIDGMKEEGLILKQLDAPYAWERNFYWTKCKRFYDVDARIIGFYPGRPKTRFEKLGVPGGAHCVAFLESGERLEFNVGSGFSDDQRAHMKEDPDWWLRRTHVVKYQEVSRAKHKEVASLRFCTYERSRDDKLVEI